MSRQSNCYTDGNIFEKVSHVFLGLLIKYIHQEYFLQMKLVVHVCNLAPRGKDKRGTCSRRALPTYTVNSKLTWDYFRLAFEIKAHKKANN